MELKVWVEGIQRVVCGVTETTTCQDVVFALAHATGKSGRFTLLERWRNNERQLAPNENPLRILMKWGEYSNDVQFVLQWTDRTQTSVVSKHKPAQAALGASSPQKSAQKHTDLGKFTFNVANSENVGVVKGVPHVPRLEVRESPYSSPKKSNGSDKTESPSQRIAPPAYKDPPAPPPYRDPPPPLEKRKGGGEKGKLQESVMYNAQYRELVALINYQREKLSNQQADLTKFDAEIVFWEGKEREKQVQLDYISQELITANNASKQNQEQIQALTYVEEETELVKQQEKTLKSELTLLRSKLANCESELLQCKNKIRLVIDELQIEQRAATRRTESRKQYEKSLLLEMERIQHDIELAKQSTELHHLTAETLKKEVAALEMAIVEKKKQVELLVSEMKEANLESLTIAPPEELRSILEGPNKGARKMIGSPRQLENAVPTNKNPHGVWV